MQVNSDNEHDFEDEQSFQALAGFLSERQSEINVDLEEAEFESESSKNQSIQDKINQLRNDIANIKEQIAQKQEISNKILINNSDDPNSMNKFLFGHEENP